ncbi:hypothetical protein BC629DRAFT_370899 [Irpex lacteus]|nr:hypothetical protein BC629DRAFT_370899 [Irpex lacteus]
MAPCVTPIMTAVTTRSAILPLDLVEYIIDELRDDRAALRSCNLTSRLWTHRARTHLHRTFTLELVTEAVTACHKYQHYSSLSELPVILQYADGVEIKYAPCCEPIDEALCSDQFWSIVHQLGHVRRIYIHDGDFTCNSRLRIDSLRWGRLFPVVEVLSLFGTTFLDSNGPLLLASRFPVLQTLELDSINAGPVEANDCTLSGEESSVQSVALRSLHVNCHDKPEILRTLLRHVKSSHSGLQSLRLSTTLGVEESTNFANFLREGETDVRDLHLVLQQDSQYPQFSSNMRREVLQRASRCIESCKNLDVLRLGHRRHFSLSMLAVIYGRQKDSFSTVWEIWAEVLQGLEKIPCRKLIFYVDARDINNRDALENVLLTRRFLLTIEVICFYIGGNYGSMARMQQSMAKWRGALRRLKSQYVVQLEFYQKREAIGDGWYIW